MFLPCFLLATISLGLPLCFCAPARLAEPDYAGSQVIRISLPRQGDEATTLVCALDLPIWSRTLDYLDVQVPPAYSHTLMANLTSRHIPHRILIPDLGVAISTERARISNRQDVDEISLDASWVESYHSYNAHISWLHKLAAAHPDSAEVYTIGRTYQNRDIHALRLGNGSKTAIIWGALHAREWTSTLAVESLALSLLQPSSPLLTHYTLHLLPLANPDGFAYSQTTDRLFRKNLQPFHLPSNETCLGVDLNRNFPHHWDVRGGAQTGPCADTFRGPGGLSAPESQALYKHLVGLVEGGGVEVFIDVHAYGGLVMYPYAYTTRESVGVEDGERLKRVAEGAAGVMEEEREGRWRVGEVAGTLYPASGTSVDMAWGEGLRNVWTIEGWGGDWGFLVPEGEELRGVVEETARGVVEILRLVGEE